jgi:hypothetical protein
MLNPTSRKNGTGGSGCQGHGGVRRPALAVFALLACTAASLQAQGGEVAAQGKAPSLDETRLTMGKWIETQQIIAKERKEWQQGKEILQGRLELVKKEVGTLTEKIQAASASVAESNKKKSELQAENEQLKAVQAELTKVVSGLEVELRKLWKQIPEPIQQKLQPLWQRVPEDPAKSRAHLGERFQNLLGILNEINKANNEMTVAYEVRNLANGKPAEVRAVYIGLTNGYYVSASGEAGVGHPTADGWSWQPANALASSVLMALEILQGKQSPAFVPLPVKIQ